MKAIFFSAFVCVTLYMNLYKFPLLFDLIRYGGSYPLFPWMSHPIMSASPNIWLVAHLYTALLTVILTTYMVYLTYDCCPPTLRRAQRILYALFTSLILVNIYHFGNFSALVATAVNGTPLAISLFGAVMALANPRCNNVYFIVHYIAMIFPILLELGFYLNR